MLIYTLIAQASSNSTIDLRKDLTSISSMTQFGPTVEGFIRGFLMLAALLTFGYMLWGALDWILSGGDSGKVESARKKITHALIGLVVLMSVGAIFLLIQSFLGINVVSSGKPTQGPSVDCRFAAPGTPGCP